MTAPPEPSAEVALPGELRMAALYDKLFRPSMLGPAVVLAATTAGGLAALKVFAPTWPLAALAIGGIASTLVWILVGDTTRAGDLVRWRDAQLTPAKHVKGGVPSGPGDAADRAATQFEDAFARDGTADPTQWQAVVARLRPEQARFHRASLAIYEAAADLAERRPWLIALDKAALELGPFEVPPMQRMKRLVFRALPLLLGIVIVELLALVLGPGLNS